MTVGEMEEKMSWSELELWLKYFEWKSESEKKAMEKMRKKKGR